MEEVLKVLNLTVEANVNLLKEILAQITELKEQIQHNEPKKCEIEYIVKLKELENFIKEQLKSDVKEISHSTNIDFTNLTFDRVE